MILTRIDIPPQLHPWLNEINALLAIYERVMDLKRRRAELHWWQRLGARVYMAYGYIRDIWFNITTAADIFRDPAREWTVTARLKRYRKTGTPKQQALAEFLCELVLDRIDPDGNHC